MSTEARIVLGFYSLVALLSGVAALVKWLA